MDILSLNLRDQLYVDGVVDRGPLKNQYEFDVENFHRNDEILRRICTKENGFIPYLGIEGDLVKHELVNGVRLSEKIKKGGINEIPLEQRINWAIGILNSVNYAHKNGLLHLDLNPSNILLGDDGNVYIFDYNIAQQIVTNPRDDLAIPYWTNFYGTPEYAAPEANRKNDIDLTIKTDIFGWGVIAAALLTGHIEPLDKAYMKNQQYPHMDEDGCCLDQEVKAQLRKLDSILAEVIINTTKYYPDQRPNFEEIRF